MRYRHVSTVRDVVKPFWASWPRLRARIAAAPRKLLLLDFDGTLAAIAPSPDAVALRPRTRRALRALARRRDFRVTVISGRALADLRPYLRGIGGVLAVGNHGLEFSGGGGWLQVPSRTRRRALSLRTLLGAFAKKCRVDFMGLPGVLVEDKGFAVAIHYRNLESRYTPAFREGLRFLRGHYRNSPLVWRRGKKVWEILPDIRWSKGLAALDLEKRFPGALPLAVGDDRTDEDMFRVLKRRGVTVRVGFSRRSGANYYLASQREIDALLESL